MCYTKTFLKSIVVVATCLLCTHAKASRSLTARQAEALRLDLQQQWLDSVRTALSNAYTTRQLVIGNDTMPVAWTVYGKQPDDGYALFISLHGGGETTRAVNDSQWRNQQRLYRPKNAVYLCPRSPFNTWNLHFLPQLDAFYRQIIQMGEAFLHVNPDKVYLMGYSAGGDGVWRVAPRMADTWAAASMMAGHPGDVSLVNLRNTPFMIWCGTEDRGVDRNKRCPERIAEMDSLHRADPEGYVFEGHMLEGKGHWMDRADTVSVDWMAQHRRNPYPRRIVWRQEEVLQPHFYWLSVPHEEMERGREVRLHVEGNTIFIERCDYKELTLSLCDRIVDLDRPVTIIFDGHITYKGKAPRRAETLRRTLYERGDPAYMFPAQLSVNIR